MSRSSAVAQNRDSVTGALHCEKELFELHQVLQSELPRPIPRNSVESDHGYTSRIYFENAGDNVTLTLYNVTLAPQSPC